MGSFGHFLDNGIQMKNLWKDILSRIPFPFPLSPFPFPLSPFPCEFDSHASSLCSMDHDLSPFPELSISFLGFFSSLFYFYGLLVIGPLYFFSSIILMHDSQSYSLEDLFT